MTIIREVMSKRIGCILISVMLGLGLATMFHKVCVGRDCVIVKGPGVKYVTEHVWRSGNDCFRYRQQKVGCPDPPDQAAQADGAAQAKAVTATDDVVG